MSQRIRKKLTETGAIVLSVSSIAGCKRVNGKNHNENIKSHVMEWDKVTNYKHNGLLFGSVTATFSAKLF